MNPFSTIEAAIEDLQQGRMVVLVDDENREQEGDLIIAAEKITPQAINFMATHARGLICLTLTEEIVDRLRIPPMPERHKLPNQAAFLTSIEAVRGVTTGVSAQDRAHTIRVAIDPNSTDQDISMPGHVFPLRAKKGGVLERPGHTEGSVDLIKLTGLQPAAVICEIMNEDGSMARLSDLIEFAEKHAIRIVSINDIIQYRIQIEEMIEEVSAANLPLEQSSEFMIKVFRDRYSKVEHVALIRGEISPDVAPLVRIHSECLTGDAFGSERCDCGWQLKKSLEQISQEGGVLLYMRQEGRGIGLANKIKAYMLQSQGLDTVEANHQLGFAADPRNYVMSAQMLRALGISQMRLLTNNPRKMNDMENLGIRVVERVSLEAFATENNIHYLRAKRDKLDHWLTLKTEG